MLKRNSIWLGIAIGILFPLILYAIIYLLIVYLKLFKADELNYYKFTIGLICIALNSIPLRYYFVNLKYDKSGKGILLVTFVLVILIFIVRS